MSEYIRSSLSHVHVWSLTFSRLSSVLKCFCYFESSTNRPEYQPMSLAGACRLFYEHFVYFDYVAFVDRVDCRIESLVI